MTRLCACGCGASLDHRHSTARFASDACRARGWKRRTGYGRQTLAEAASGAASGVRTPLSQEERVLRALRQVGSRGVTAVDFDPPNVIDGREPIQRLAARVLALKGKGHRIDVVGKRNRCAIYQLQEEKRLAAVPEPAPASLTLFDPSEARARPVNAIGGGDAA